MRNNSHLIPILIYVPELHHVNSHPVPDVDQALACQHCMGTTTFQGGQTRWTDSTFVCCNTKSAIHIIPVIISITCTCQ